MLFTKIFKRGNQFNSYLDWKINNKYFNKQISILGDSISTLEGYNPAGYNVFFKGDICTAAGVKEMGDTWWGKVIDFFGGKLLVNNSWSGSRVTKLPNQAMAFPSGCSDERTFGLHINSVKPDMIIIYLGTNDWASGAANFKEAYEMMLRKIRINYPNSDIWCCTLSETKMLTNKNFQFPYSYGGTHIEVFNEMIRNEASLFHCGIIDLYQYHIPYDSIDGTHPTVDGMNTLAALVIRSMAGEEAASFYKKGQYKV